MASFDKANYPRLIYIWVGSGCLLDVLSWPKIAMRKKLLNGEAT